MKRLAQGKISRRGFLILAGLGAAGVSVPYARHKWNLTRRYRHVPGKADDSAFDQGVVNTLVEFLAAFFGVPIDEIDRVDLQQRLTLAVRVDGGWRVEYQTLARIADRFVAALGGRTFVETSQETRARVIHTLALSRRSKLRNRLKALISSDGRDFLRMQKSTIPHLVNLYRRSGVPWRHRGYQTWPGVAGDMLAYTHAPVSGGL